MADMTPPAGAADFLDRAGWGGAVIAPLAGDASFRRYFRVEQGNERAVLMDAPPPHEDPRPFLAVGGWLTERGFGAPAILASDLDQGLVLLEDFGDARMREIVDAEPDRVDELYAEAVYLLIDLHQHPAGPFAPYDRDVLHREAALLAEWYCPAVGLDIDVDGYRVAWDAVFEHISLDDPVTVLRDYHAENLMVVGNRDDWRWGVLDFQDALAGHRAYDLVSLLQDARRSVEPELERGMLGLYLAQTGAGEDFMRAYYVLGAQRNAKIIGIFTRLWKRDGKARYAALCPRVWAYLERDLAEPVLEPVRRWFDANVPTALRGDPMALGS